MLRILSAILAVGLCASQASAVLTAEFVDIDNSAALSGYVTQDLMITTTVGDDWGLAELLVTLDDPNTQHIYQDPNGSDYEPNPAFFPSFPTLEFDSYLSGNGEQPFIAGQAVDLGGDAQEFSAGHIDITWLNTKQDDYGQDPFGIGRFTLSDNASGSWSMYVSSTNGFRTYQGRIENGMFDLRDTGGGEPLLGDLNEDGFVGIGDLNIVLGEWNQTIVDGNAPFYGDLTSDFFVGIQDLNIILGNWNQIVLPGDYTAGDITGDGFVGIQDLNVILGNWNFQIPQVDERADTNFDMFIGIQDLNTVLGDWNQGTPPGGAGSAVPEPAGLTLGLLLASAALTRRIG